MHQQGFSLAELRELLDLYDAPDGEVEQLQHALQMVREQIRAMQGQLEDVTDMLRELRGVEEQFARLLRENGSGRGDGNGEKDR